jgi:hypothetical protein
MQLGDTLAAAAAAGVSGSDGCLQRPASMQGYLLTLLLLLLRRRGLTKLVLLV